MSPYINHFPQLDGHPCQFIPKILKSIWSKWFNTILIPEEKEYSKYNKYINTIEIIIIIIY